MRIAVSGMLLLAALALPATSLAADPMDLRPAYPDQWDLSPDNSLRFETGLRYWLSWGEQDAGFAVPNLGDVTLGVRDNSHIVEAHGRIDDLYTNTFLKAQAGLALATTGTYAIAPAGAGSIGAHSQIGYAGFDYGWMPLGKLDGPFALGGFAGYTYWKDAPDIGTGQVATSFAGGMPGALVAAPDNLDIHALRLGVRGTAEAGPIDFQGEVAFVPYAHVSGALGGSGPNAFVFPGAAIYENAQTPLTGWGSGVMTEAMVGFHPTDNLTLRLGGRAWYLQGELDATFNGEVPGLGALPPQNLSSSFASIFRYGALFEVAGRF